MGPQRRFAVLSISITLLATLTGCSSGAEKAPQGSFAVKLSASSRAAEVQPGQTVPGDPVSRLLAADITLSGIEVRRSDGRWVPVADALPRVVNVLALANGGGTLTLPADLAPEGQYTAIQLKVSKVELTELPAASVTIAARGVGWTVMLPADFGVATGGSTIVALNLRLDRSIRLVNGSFDFEPDFETVGVQRD